MTLEEIFTTLLETQRITLSLSRVSANSLRTSLLRKLKDYKIQTEALGWLGEDVAKSTISLEFSGAEESGTARIYLRPKKRIPVSYTLISEEPSPAATND